MLYLFQAGGEWFVQYEDEEPSDGIPTRERAIAFIEAEWPEFSYVEQYPSVWTKQLTSIDPNMKNHILAMITQQQKNATINTQLINATQFSLAPALKWGQSRGSWGKHIRLNDYADWQHRNMFKDFGFSQSQIDAINIKMASGVNVEILLSMREILVRDQYNNVIFKVTQP